MSCFRQIVNVSNWRNSKYVIWALAVPSALFGYFVPYVHIVRDLGAQFVSKPFILAHEKRSNIVR